MQLRYISIAALIAEAGGDPWAINQSLQAGRPAQISDLAEAFHAAGRSTAEANASFEQARRRFGAAWNHQNGDNPINDSAEVQRAAQSLGTQSEQLPKIGADLENIAAALAEAQQSAGRQIATLEGQLQQLDDLIGQAVELEKDSRLSAEDRSALDAFIRTCEDDAVNDAKAALGQLHAIRDGYSDSLQKSLTSLRADGYDPSVLQGVDASGKPQEPIQIPPPNTKPEDVKRWWSSLTKEQQDQLIAAHPQALGNLDGISGDVRGQVNAAVLNDDLHRVEDVARQHGLSPDALRDNVLNDRDDDMFANPAKYGLSPADITRYQNAVKTNQGIEHDKGPDKDHPRPVSLWAYDPLAFGGKGRAAIGIGNLDRSQNTAVIVPGTNSSVKGGWLYDGHNDAINLYDQSLKADPTHSTAVLAWIGYNAPEFDFQHPESAVVDPSKLQQVGTPWMARDGGALLAADVNSLAVTHDGSIPSHVTVIGHSYGSTTVADAFALSGMHANDAVLIGCPGTDLARTAADFHLNGGHVYVGAASTDAISWIGESGPGVPNAINEVLGQPLGALAGLGGDPAHDGFGAIRFRAEVAGSQSAVPWFNDHSHYYDMGSEALHNMIEIATGHGGNLAGEGMLAPDRAELTISTPREVQTPFGTTLPLPHVEIHTPVTVDPEWDRPADSVTNDHGFK
jgi:hydrolase family protein/alpha/beta hydrolase family protein